ncbi:Glycosaminoglycan_polysaccharide lyase [Hexamita inflata]|uniref:Putative n=1 Tax=Hexamita inflata TaxID=28002 RepID=A0AA86N983_9EUKA|nr:Glycosaminoglycan polysaccharide lyase [Hexamita inflata]
MIYLCLIITDAYTDDVKKILQNKKDMLTQNKYNSLVCPDYITNNANAANYYISNMITNPDRSYLWDDWKRIDQGPQLQSTLENLYQIAIAYAIEPFENYTNPHYKNIYTLNIITDALDLILTRYYKASLKFLTVPLSGLAQNWWEWQIGIPEVLNNIIILIQDSLSDTLFDKFVQASRRFIPNPSHIGKLYGSTMPILMPSTGGNLVDTARICFIRGLLSLNISESDNAFNSLQNILDFVTVLDGFYKDYSFIQHQSLASSASYGAVLFSGLTNLIVIINESILYNYNKSSISNIFDFMLKAELPLIYNGQMMNMVNGRGISRTEQEYSNGKTFIGLMAILSECAPTYQIQLQMKKLVKHHCNKALPLYDFTQQSALATMLIKKIMQDVTIPQTLPEYLHKRFSSMARVVHRRENFAFSIAMHSYKVGDYESIDGENLHGWYTGDGMEYMYSKNQNQYIDFFPTVDPYLLQGTTELAIKRNNSERDGVRKYLTSNATFVGGTDLDGIGVVGMEFYNFNYKLSGFRSWFLFNSSVMVLADYKSTSQFQSSFLNRGLQTLAQKVYVDKVLVNEGVQKMNCSKLFVEGTGVNDSIGIIFLQPTEIYIKKELRTGDWSDIGLRSGAVQRNYVTGYVQAENVLQLKYLIVFGLEYDQFQDYQPDHKVEMNQYMHAVEYVENNVTFNAANIFNLPAGQTININNFTILSNASVLIKQANKIQISISDPTQKQKSVKFVTDSKVVEVNVTHAEGTSFVFEYINPDVDVPNPDFAQNRNKCGLGCITTTASCILCFAIIIVVVLLCWKRKSSKGDKYQKQFKNFQNQMNAPIAYQCGGQYI